MDHNDVKMAVSRRMKEDSRQLIVPPELFILKRTEVNRFQLCVQVILYDGDFVEVEIVGDDMIESWPLIFFDRFLQLANGCCMRYPDRKPPSRVIAKDPAQNEKLEVRHGFLRERRESRQPLIPG
jgi:hypothetical protein